jgi:hypothetical protein
MFIRKFEHYKDFKRTLSISETAEEKNIMPRNNPSTITSPRRWKESHMADGAPYWHHMDTREVTTFNPHLGALPPSWVEVHQCQQIFVQQRFSRIRATNWDPREYNRHRNKYMVNIILRWQGLTAGNQVDILRAVAEDINKFLPSLTNHLQERTDMTGVTNRYESNINLTRSVEAIETWVAVASGSLRERKSRIANISGSDEEIAQIKELLEAVENLEAILEDVGDQMRNNWVSTSRYQRLLEKLGQWNIKLIIHLS